jgi:hypothetical protein
MSVLLFVELSDLLTGACTNPLEGEWGIFKQLVRKHHGANNMASYYSMLTLHQWKRWVATEYPGGPICCALSLLRK